MPEPGLPTLATDRLILRPWRGEDVAAAFDIYSRWSVMRFLGRSPVVESDLEQSRARVARWAGLPGPLHGVWAIVPKDGTAPVGSALMKLLPLSGGGEPSAHTEIGWHLHPDAWGHGYATEAGSRLIQHAWDHGLTEVYAVTYPENGPSQAVCRRLGMEHLGKTDRFYDLTCELFRLGRPAESGARTSGRGTSQQPPRSLSSERGTSEESRRVVPTHLTVVGAVIERDGFILCAQRATGSLAGRWEFPGGKVEPGESAEAALAREILEELGCVIQVGDEITTASHDYDFGRVTMTTYRCRLVSGTPVASEHAALTWLRPSDLNQLTWAPVDLPTVGLLLPDR